MPIDEKTKAEREVMKRAVSEALKTTSGNPQLEVSELQAIRKLAVELFGEAGSFIRTGPGFGGVVELDGSGMIYVGYFVDPPALDAARGAQSGRGITPRRSVIKLSGRSIGELTAQARILKFSGAL